MNIIVCIKQVPDTTEVKINPETGTLIREGVPSIINPFDTYAIEEGLLLKEKFGGKVTVISMGPPQATEALKEAVAMGADKGIKAVLDPYNPRGSTRFVGFNTTKDVYATDARKCHVDHVAMDSEWEGELARVVEAHPRVLAYVKNQGLQFEVPYRDGGVPKRYLPTTQPGKWKPITWLLAWSTLSVPCRPNAS